MGTEEKPEFPSRQPDYRTRIGIRIFRNLIWTSNRNIGTLDDTISWKMWNTEATINCANVTPLPRNCACLFSCINRNAGGWNHRTCDYLFSLWSRSDAESSVSTATSCDAMVQNGTTPKLRILWEQLFSVWVSKLQYSWYQVSRKSHSVVGRHW